jgi:hypothetical protein
MSNFQTLAQLNEGRNGTNPTVFSGVTSDALATMLAAGYLNDMAHIIKPNDVFFINYADVSTFPVVSGESSIFGEFSVVKVSSNYNLVPRLQSYASGITAHAGGGQGSATPLNAKLNSISTVGSANDSVLLPNAAPGSQIVVNNAAAANSMRVFPQSGQSINALSANAGFDIAANKTAIFFCMASGVWEAILTA